MGSKSFFCIGALLVLLMVPLLGSANAYSPPNYNRIEEVEKICEPYVNAASQLEADEDKAYKIMRDLSFTAGDWDQEPGIRPFLPFVDAIASDDADMLSPFKLSGFKITAVDIARESRNAVGVNGVLNLVITWGEHPMYGFFEVQNVGSTPQFQMLSSHTRVSIVFQGLYSESRKNGGERVLCLLGNAILPVRSQFDSTNPWGDIETSDSMTYKPPLLRDDKILLVLHYPANFTLTKRAVHGEMRSLNSETDLGFFDRLHISSQLCVAEYKFGSVDLDSACDPYPYLDTDIYRGDGFCSLFEKFQLESILGAVIYENDGFYGKLGPFLADADVKLLIQHVRCEQKHTKNNHTVAWVSLVLRAVPGHGNHHIERRRSGLGNMTIAAEGTWNSSQGQLCMVGCLESSCDLRVCFYIPTTFSIKRRGALVGTISSVRTETASELPLLFQFPLQGELTWLLHSYANFQYKYSKVGLAQALSEKHGSSFGNVIKKYILNFPRLRNVEDYNLSLSLLSEDLSFYLPAVLDADPNPRRSTHVDMNIISIGSIFDPYSYLRNSSFNWPVTPYQNTMKQHLVNVSSQLSIGSEADSNIPPFYLEGIYDPLVGKMYSIGCRNVHKWRKISLETVDVDDAYDCSISVVISYPPIKAQWLVSPIFHISIVSQRAKGDPLYFKPVSVKTLQVVLTQQSEGKPSERAIKGLLCVFTLSLSIICFASQLSYIRSAADSVPYISVVMLAIQALGNALPQHSESYATLPFFLVMIASLLTTRLIGEVKWSRVGSSTNDKLVLALTLVIHSTGIIFVWFLYPSRMSQPSFVSQLSFPWQMMFLLEDYVGLAQDLFLLPQVIGNLVWRVNCKPMRNLYYIGFTAVRLVPRLYDRFNTPGNEYLNLDSGSYSKSNGIFIPAIAVLLAVIVHTQQRWGYDKLSRTFVAGRCRLLPFGSKLYQKLA